MPDQKYPTQTAEPVGVFERCADMTLAAVTATYAQRGKEYVDSWSADQMVTIFSDHAARIAGFSGSLHTKRLCQAAAMIDVKLSRVKGPYKRDTLVDLIAYLACYAQLVEDYIGETTKADAPPPDRKEASLQ